MCIFLIKFFFASIAMALDALDGLHSVILHRHKRWNKHQK